MNGTGTEEIINLWLDLKNKGARFDTTTGCKELSCRKSCGDAFYLITDLYSQIDTKWTSRNYLKSPSSKNWRLTQELEIAEANTSTEKRLEKNIAKLNDGRWFNQVPSASGLFGAHIMGKASIDLVRKTGPAAYEFVELKCKTNNPLYAAIEILLYGLLYIHARDYQSVMKYELKERPLLTADEIGLRVLAPKAYYRNYELGWFESELSHGLAKFARKRFKMDFKFTTFPVAFQWDKACSEEELQVSLHGITSAFS